MNANTNINVLGGILDAMLANLTEHIDKRVEAKVFTLTERITVLEHDLVDLGADLNAVEGQLYNLKNATPSVFQPTDDVILRLDKMREDTDSLMNCQDHDQMENSRRITELEKERADDLMEQQYRIKMFEKLEAHLSEERPATTATLDQTEEFRLAVCKIIDTHTMGDEFLNPLVTALIDNGEFVDAINKAAREVARSEAEEAVSDHNSEYCHDDIHEKSDIDEDAVTDIIKEVLNNTTVTLNI